jgi:hypothetical protein
LNVSPSNSGFENVVRYHYSIWWRSALTLTLQPGISIGAHGLPIRTYKSPD